MATYELCNLGDGMAWAQYAFENIGTVDPSKVPLECLILYIMTNQNGFPFVLTIGSGSVAYLYLYDAFMARFANRTIRCHYAESSQELLYDYRAIATMTDISTIDSRRTMSMVRYKLFDVSDPLNEAAKNLQFLDGRIQKYFEKVITLHDAMESMIGSSASLDDWVNERGYQISSATVNGSTMQSVSHPLDASDLDSGIADDSTKNDYSGTYDAKSMSRDSNLITQFKTLWNNWTDVKNEILDDCECWFVNTFSAW